MRIIIITLLVLITTVCNVFAQTDEADKKSTLNNNAKKGFLGVFFLDSYPVTGCEIIKMRPSVIRSTTEFRAPEREEFNNNKNFSKIIHTYQGDLITEAQTIAEKEGYNAIIGSKFYINTYYQGVSNLGAVDGNIGYGLGSITYIGHPVFIMCEDLAASE